MLSAEGRSAYAQWRGEEDSCRPDDLDSACDAAISSLSTISCGSWLEVDLSSRTQSLFYGEPHHRSCPCSTAPQPRNSWHNERFHSCCSLYALKS